MSFLSKSLTILTLGLMVSNQAFAADSVVVPLYSPNLNSSKVGNITSLITSEVDFSGRYDMVSQATQRPSTLTPKCLKSVSCLRPIAQKEGVDAMITGSVTKVGNELEFFIILYERSMIIRMKRFRIEDSPLTLAADVGGYIQEVVTGEAPATEEDSTGGASLTNALDEEGDIFGGEEDPLDFSLDPEEDARKAAAARADEARQAEEARRRQAMEEQARRLAMEAEAARLAAEANQATEEEDDFDFDFAPSTVEVVDDTSSSDGIVEEDDLTLNFDEPKPKKTKSEPKKEAYPSGTSYNSSRTKKSKSSKSVSSGRIDATATMTGKVGAGNFQSLNFVTYGGEVGVHMSDAVSVQIAADGFATYQSSPVLDDNGEPTDVIQQSWRLLIPVSLGVLYHFEGDMAKPYVGADLQVLPAYAGVGSGVAVGLRGRVGSNFMVADNFGFNVNVGLGFWNGQYFVYTTTPTGAPLKPTGFTPQISAGPLVTF